MKKQEIDTSAVMLFKCPGAEITWGISHDFVTVTDSEVDGLLADGWHRQLMDADKAHKDATQAALDAKTAEVKDLGNQLGLKAVHKGAGKWSLVDKDGNEIETGLTKDEAQAKAA